MIIYVQVHALINLLSKSEQATVHSKITFEQRKFIQLFCLNQLKASFGLQSAVIEKNQYGKPYLVNDPTVQFNQSHSQLHYVLIMSNNIGDIGVDLEDVTRDINMYALALRYFHSDEMSVWQQSGQSKVVWLKIWTAKEAVLKAHGLGIRLYLKTLNTCSPNLINSVEHPQLGCFRYVQYVDEQYVMSIAYRDCGKKVEYQWINDLIV